MSPRRTTEELEQRVRQLHRSLREHIDTRHPLAQLQIDTATASYEELVEWHERQGVYDEHHSENPMPSPKAHEERWES